MFTDGNSNMTCAEYYRLHGTLSQERIEALLEQVELLEEEIEQLQHYIDGLEWPI